jgi:hypothetical protein
VVVDTAVVAGVAVLAAALVDAGGLDEAPLEELELDPPQAPSAKTSSAITMIMGGRAIFIAFLAALVGGRSMSTALERTVPAVNRGDTK